MTYVFSGLGYDVAGNVGVSSDCYSGGANRATAVACAGEAGGKAAGAACLATPGLELAAPLCSEAGQWIAENLAGPLYDGAATIFEGIFGGPKGTPPAEAHAAGAWHVDVARMTYDLLAASLMLKYAGLVIPAVTKAGGKADPMDLRRAQMLLDTFGAKKMMADQIASGKPYGLYKTLAMKCWFTGKDWWLPYKEMGSLNSANCGMMLADPVADAWRLSMAPAYGKALTWMTNDAAKQVAKAKAAAKLEDWHADAGSREFHAPAKVWPWVAGIAAIGGGAYWLHRRRRRRRR